MAALPRPRRRRERTPAWIVTFADLATLLLTFFILLLSFAEMDLEKYRSMARSMAGAFGSDRVLPDAIGGPPLAVIATETVPAEPVAPEPGPFLIDERGQGPGFTEVPEGIVELASRLIRELEPEVADQALNITHDTRRVVIRFSEQATFRSGEATIKQEMLPIIDRIVSVLAPCLGDVVVAGHTDDVPITSGRYRSNWDLSSARAVSVVHELVLNQRIPAQRVVATGRAETNPLVANDSAENRARNRRVEIVVREPACDDTTPEGGLPVEVLP